MGVFVGVCPRVSTAAGPDRFDLASISIQPAYVSPSQIRVSSTLHAVAFSPLDPHAPPPTRSVSMQTAERTISTIGIAVGDAGTILRSDDGGESWWPIEYAIAAEDGLENETPVPSGLFGMGGNKMGAGSRKALSGKRMAMPFCEFSDVLWLSPRDVVVVGGGYEPVTGISRGVCVFSRDAGQTWRLADAHEMPRLRQLRMADRGRVAAKGDAAEASGVDSFASYDGGESWVEDNVPSSRESGTVGGAESQPLRIETEQGEVTVNAVVQTPDSTAIAVGAYGRIFRRTAGQRQWRAVRGVGRHAGVLFVAASPGEVPWALVGRETLQENRRVAILIDGRVLDTKQLDRCRAAAAMLGVGDVGVIGSSVIESSAARSWWLDEHRPGVVALDDSLSPSARRGWLDTMEASRTHSFSQLGDPVSNRWVGPKRVVLVRPVGGDAYPDWQHSGWQRAWGHSSVLRRTALLTGPGVLASDLSLDACALVAPAMGLASGWEVTTLEDVSGSIRRDVSLSAGVNLDAGQSRDEPERNTASHRRLQITTARVNQTARLLGEIDESARGSCSPSEVTRFGEQIEHLLATTAEEGRTRLLWEAFLHVNGERDAVAGGTADASALRGLFLGLLSRHAEPASVRRWAEMVMESESRSVELKSRRPLAHLANRARGIDSRGQDVSADADLPVSAPESFGDVGSGGQPVSPFQIQPVSYESPSQPSLQILVPASEPTVWQSTGGLHGRISFTGSRKQAGTSSPVVMLPRVNWDYHRVVMGARGIASVSREMPGGVDAGGRAGSIQGTPAYRPPRVLTRPLLDGVDEDACWREADLWGNEWLSNRCVADDDYLYFVVVTDRVGGVRLDLDCDGDFLAFLRLEVLPDGTGRAGCYGIGAGGVGSFSPVWYSASRTLDSGSGSGSASIVDGSTRWTAEVAIARSSLPAAVRRVRVSLREGDDSRWEMMPDASQWHPAGFR